METVSYADWERDGFSGLKIGDTILTSRPGHWLTWGIIIITSIRMRKAVTWRHAMRYKGQGRVWSQEGKMRDAPLSDWNGQLVRIYSNPAYSEYDRRYLEAQAALKEGRGYDGLGCFVGQFLRVIPGRLGDWLASVVQLSAFNYCSEGHCEDEKTRNPEFMKGRSCAIAPTETDAECNRLGYKCWTFKLVK